MSAALQCGQLVGISVSGSLIVRVAPGNRGILALLAFSGVSLITSHSRYPIPHIVFGLSSFFGGCGSTFDTHSACTGEPRESALEPSISTDLWQTEQRNGLADGRILMRSA